MIWMGFIYRKKTDMRRDSNAERRRVKEAREGEEHLRKAEGELVKSSAPPPCIYPVRGSLGRSTYPINRPLAVESSEEGLGCSNLFLKQTSRCREFRGKMRNREVESRTSDSIQRLGGEFLWFPHSSSFCRSSRVQSLLLSFVNIRRRRGNRFLLLLLAR